MPAPSDTDLLEQHKLYVPEFAMQFFPKPQGWNSKEHARFNDAFMTRLVETGCYRTIGGVKLMTRDDIAAFMDSLRASRPGFDGVEPANPPDDAPGTISIYGDFASPDTPVCVLWSPWGQENVARQRLEAISPEPLPDMRAYPCTAGQAAAFRSKVKRHQYRGYWFLQRQAFWDALRADFAPPSDEDQPEHGDVTNG